MKKIAVLATLLACVAAAPAVQADDHDAEIIMQAAMAKAGQRIFTKCEACHKQEEGKPSFGPSLHGVIGRQAGTLPDFNYSPAMKAAGHTWTENKLRLWMADNTSLVPGTRMRHISITDPAEQDYLLAFLKTLK